MVRPGTFCRRMKHFAVLGTAVAAAWTGDLGMEVEVGPKRVGGLFVAAVEVGTPPQKVWVQIHTAAEVTYIPDTTESKAGGFISKNSSSAVLGSTKQRFTFADGINVAEGFSVQGVLLRETVKIGTLKSTRMPMLLAENFTGRKTPPAGVGLLGLCIQAETSSRQADALNPFSEESDIIRKDYEVGGVIEDFWKQHPEVAKTYLLELGGPKPRLNLGSASSEGPRVEGGFRFLSTTFTSRRSFWYVSVRAIGLSFGKDSPFLQWNRDFNAGLRFGAPALLDSGSAAIHIGSAVYLELIGSLPGGCQRETWGTTCPCDPNTIGSVFPSISISFEASTAFRIVGLDSGADVIACMPPEAYVSFDEGLKRCNIAIVDGGPRHKMFTYEAIVLGVPFFRSVSVFLDVEQRRVGIGAPLTVGPPEPTIAVQDKCLCADPKNWWSTGKRFSPKRVVVVIVGVALLGVYIFVAHSPSRTAEGLRNLAESLWESLRNSCDRLFGGSAGGQSLGGAANTGAASGDQRHGTSDRPFIQMAGRGGPE